MPDAALLSEIDSICDERDRWRAYAEYLRQLLDAASDREQALKRELAELRAGKQSRQP